MARKPVTKGGPRPDIKDYKGLPNGQALFEEDIAKWQKLNIGTPSPSSPATQPGGAVVPVDSLESDTVVKSGSVRTDWKSFTDGSFNLQEDDAKIGGTPYVTGKIEKYGETPTPIVILPSSDGQGFNVVPREELLQQIVTSIKKDPNKYYLLETTVTKLLSFSRRIYDITSWWSSN